MMQMMAKAGQFKSKMEELRTRVESTVVEGSASGGAVKCQVKARQLISLDIDPSLVNAEEKDLLEDMVTAAVNNALQNAEKLMSDETKALMRSLGLPENIDLPF